MNLIDLIPNLLEHLNISVLYLIRPIEFPGITYHFFNQEGVLYGDGDEQQEIASCQIDIWSKKADYTQLKKEIRSAMKIAGFLFSNASDTYENDVQLYHGVLTFNFYYESED